LDLLGRFLNPKYLSGREQLAEELGDQSTLAFPDFFLPSVITSGQRETWEVQGPAHRQRYLLQSKNQLSELFASESFRRWLQEITQYTILSQRSGLRKFRKGSDYTLATAQDVATIDFCVPLTSVGLETFIAPADAEDQDAETYDRTDAAAIIHQESAMANVGRLVIRGAGVLKFVGYIHSSYETDRIDVEGTYGIDLEEEVMMEG